MIRRTRADIESMYKSDMKAQNLTFPQITPPQDLNYVLDSSSHNLATDTILFLANDKQNKSQIGEFGYHRYLIYPNLTQEGKKEFIENYGRDTQGDDRFYSDTANRLSVLMQKILFKRFDSSIEAFKATLEMMVRSHNALIEMFTKDNIAIPKNYDNREKLYEAIESDDDEQLNNFLESKEDKFILLKSNHFKPEFLQNLKSDRDALENLLKKWQKIHSDSKFDTLFKFLKSKQDQKIVLFTEAAKSATYIERRLTEERFNKHLCVDSSNRDELEIKIRENFDANYPKDKQKNDYSLIISTDTLAEGVNLHRANIIINYDTPYNATRLMQRIGHINRIGTSFEEIYIYNFKPTHLTDKIINIINISLQKLQSFHYTLGEDSAIFDESEEAESQKIFSKTKQEDKEESPDTKYQKDLKEIYEKDKAYFEKIKAMPTKARTIIHSDTTQSYTYIKQTYGDKNDYYPYHITSQSTSLLNEAQAEDCDFYEIAEFLRAHLDSKSLKHIPTKIHFDHMQEALTQHKNSLKATTIPSLKEPSLSPKEQAPP